jgi:hypothetical protein
LLRFLEFLLADVKEPQGISPLQTFEAAGRTMFVDEDCFANKELLQRLLPESPFDIDPAESRGQEGQSSAEARQDQDTATQETKP